MDSSFLYYAHLIFVGFFALFPPVNPIGTAFVVEPLLRGLDPKERRAASRRIAIYCFMVCVVATLLGGWIFKFFGISLPVVQLAGGLLICKMGWQLLGSPEAVKESEVEAAPAKHRGNVDQILFYPLAFPMTTGAGTISVLLTLSAQAHSQLDWSVYLMHIAAIIVAIILMCEVIYLSYASTPALLNRLGARGGQIVNRLSAFLVFCVGIQIAVEGVTKLLQGARVM